MSVLKNTIKEIGHRASLSDMVGQTYPLYACTSTNYARFFIPSQCILRWLEARDFKVTLETNMIGRNYREYEIICCILCEKIAQF